MPKAAEPLSAERVAAARQYANSELERCAAELDNHVGATALAMAQNEGPAVMKGVEAVEKLRSQVALLRAVMPKFDALDAQIERDRAIVLAEDRLAELTERAIPAAAAALDAAEKEPRPASADGRGLRAFESYSENIAGHRANCRRLQDERNELEARVAQLHRGVGAPAD